MTAARRRTLIIIVAIAIGSLAGILTVLLPHHQQHTTRGWLWLPGAMWGFLAGIEVERRWPTPKRKQ